MQPRACVRSHALRTARATGSMEQWNARAHRQCKKGSGVTIVELRTGFLDEVASGHHHMLPVGMAGQPHRFGAAWRDGILAILGSLWLPSPLPGVVGLGSYVPQLLALGSAGLALANVCKEPHRHRCGIRALDLHRLLQRTDHK